MTRRVCGVILTLLILGSQPGEAQVRQISGRITDAQTEQGLPEATIAVAGTQIVAQAGNDGRFVLNAPEGDATLTVRGIGYKRRQVTVPAGQESVDVAQQPDGSLARRFLTKLVKRAPRSAGTPQQLSSDLGWTRYPTTVGTGGWPISPRPSGPGRRRT